MERMHSLMQWDDRARSDTDLTKLRRSNKTSNTVAAATFGGQETQGQAELPHRVPAQQHSVLFLLCAAQLLLLTQRAMADDNGGLWTDCQRHCQSGNDLQMVFHLLGRLEDNIIV